MAQKSSLSQLALVVLVLAAAGVAGHPDPHIKSLFQVDRVRLLLSQEGVAASLTPNVTALTAPGEAVAVAVRGVRAPLPTDVVAAYAAPSDAARVVPLAWRSVASGSPQYLETGDGSVTFRLANHRADVVFRLLRNATNPVPGAGRVIAVAAESPVVSARAIRDRPSQGHLGLNAQGRIVVQWVSGSGAAQQVQWGAAPGALTYSAPSAALTYAADQMCGAPANSTGWLDPGWQHSAALPSLPPGAARVHYRFGSDAAGWSRTFSFAAPPQRGAPTRFLVFNDVGTVGPVLFDDVCPPYCPGGLTFDVGYGANSTKLLRLLPGEAADAALLLGDLSYAQGFAADWDVFGEMFEAAAFTRWPVLVGVGNHERDWPGTGDAFEGLSRDSGGECGVPYALRFVTPAPRPALLGAGEAPAAAAQRLQHFYSANVGAVHFLVLDSEAPTHAGSPQRAFAEADLARVDRAATPWVVVGLHRMVYAPSSDRRRVVGDQAVMARLRADLDALFTAHWVDAVFTGHEHAYARTCALRNGACDGARGTVHILAGNAGAGFTHNFPRRADGRGGYDLEPWVVAAAQDVNGYVRVAATAAEMRIEAVRSDDGAVFDAVTLRARSSGGGRGSVTKSGSGQGSTSSGSSTTAASSSSGRAGGSGGGGGASRWNGVWAPLAALWRGWSIS